MGSIQKPQKYGASLGRPCDAGIHELKTAVIADNNRPQIAALKWATNHYE